MPTETAAENPEAKHLSEVDALLQQIAEMAPQEAAELLDAQTPDVAARVLARMNSVMAQDIVRELPSERRQKVFAAAEPEIRKQWMRNEAYPEDTVGNMMEAPLAVYRPETTIAQATADLRHLTKRAFITYAFVADENERLLGVVVLRDMLVAEDESLRLEQIMLKNPFTMRPEMTLEEAMRETVVKHYPVYPVCDAEGRLLGLVRGQTLFEAQALELTAQAGSMVGVEKEERLSTPWSRSLKFRHPWLQLNLLTAFVAAAVVGVFESTVDRIVVLAVFLPVLAGQSGNTGCQALAVALRGITLGEVKGGKAKAMVAKEALLGLLNGALVGVTAGIGMFVYANMQKNPAAVLLGFIVFVSMICSCVISGVFGAVVPLTLKKLGADPATASSIFLTTATDVVSMGTFLGLATMLVR